MWWTSPTCLGLFIKKGRITWCRIRILLLFGHLYVHGSLKNESELCVLFFDVQGSMTNLAKLAPAAGISWFVFEETKVMLGLSMRS